MGVNAEKLFNIISPNRNLTWQNPLVDTARPTMDQWGLPLDDPDEDDQSHLPIPKNVTLPLCSKACLSRQKVAKENVSRLKDTECKAALERAEQMHQRDMASTVAETRRGADEKLARFTEFNDNIIDTLQVRLRRQQALHETTIAEHAATGERHVVLQGLHTHLEEAYSALLKYHEAEVEKAAKCDKDLADLETQIKVVSDNLAESQASLVGSKEANEALKTKITAQKTKHDQSIKMFAEESRFLAGEVSIVRENNRNLAERLDQEDEKRICLEETKRSLELKQEELSKERDKLQPKISTLTETADKNERHNAELKEHAQSYRKECEGLRGAILTLHGDFERLMNDHTVCKEECHNLNEKVQELHGDLEQVMKEHAGCPESPPVSWRGPDSPLDLEDELSDDELPLGEPETELPRTVAYPSPTPIDTPNPSDVTPASLSDLGCDVPVSLTRKEQEDIGNLLVDCLQREADRIDAQEAQKRSRQQDPREVHGGKRRCFQGIMPCLLIATLVVIFSVGYASADENRHQHDQRSQEVLAHTFHDVVAVITYMAAALALTATAITFAALAVGTMATTITKAAPRNQVSKARAVYMTLVILLVTTAFASPDDLNDTANKTIIEDGIVFQHRGSALVNVPVTRILKQYRPCDLILFKSKLDDIVKKYQDLCKTSILEEYKSSLLVERVEQDFILLKENMTMPSAKQACHSLGATLITIKSKEDAGRLGIFMHNTGIRYVHAGLEWNRPTAEVVFSDTKHLASGVAFTDVYDKANDDQISWTETHELANSAYKGSYFEYKRLDKERRNNGIAVVLWQENDIEGYADAGWSRTDRVICNKPGQAAKSLHNIQMWQEQCLDRQQRLAHTVSALAQQIKNILPTNQKPPTAPLEHTISFRPKTSMLGSLLHTDHQVRTKNSTKTLESILHDNTMPLEQQCTAVLETLRTNSTFQKGPPTPTGVTRPQTRRRKRAVSALAVIPMVLSVIEFAAKGTMLGVKLSNYRKSHHWDKKPGRNSDILRQILTENNYDESLDVAIKFTAATNAEIQLSQEAEIIAEYIHEATKKLATVINDVSYQPSAHEFMTHEEYKELQNFMRDEFNAQIPKSIKFLKTAVLVRRNSFLVETMVPVNPHQYQADLYQLHGLGTYRGGERFEPLMHAKYVAIATAENSIFTVLSKDELTNCVKQQFCTTQKPATTNSRNLCGLCFHFWKYDCCEYKPARDSLPRFLTIGTKTFYVTNPNKPVNAKIKCFNEVRSSGLVIPGTMTLEGAGYFVLGVACEARLNSDRIIIRPSMSARTPAQNRFPATGGKEDKFRVFRVSIQRKGVAFDIKNLNPDKVLRQFVMPALIATAVTACVVAVAIVAFLIYVKFWGGTKIKSIVTNLKHKDVEKTMEVRQRRDRRAAAREAANQTGVNMTNSIGGEYIHQEPLYVHADPRRQASVRADWPLGMSPYRYLTQQAEELDAALIRRADEPAANAAPDNDYVYPPPPAYAPEMGMPEPLPPPQPRSDRNNNDLDQRQEQRRRFPAQRRPRPHADDPGYAKSEP